MAAVLAVRNRPVDYWRQLVPGGERRVNWRDVADSGGAGANLASGAGYRVDATGVRTLACRVPCRRERFGAVRATSKRAGSPRTATDSNRAARVDMPRRARPPQRSTPHGPDHPDFYGHNVPNALSRIARSASPTS